MWRALQVKFLRAIPTDVDLIEALNADPKLRDVCGLGDRVPSPSMLSRFRKRLLNHQDLVDSNNNRLVALLARLIDNQTDIATDGVGCKIAIDSTDIASFANPRRDPPTDPDAAWGHKTSSKVKDGKRVEYVFGFKMHAVVDATFGIPITYEILPANASDSPQLPKLVRKAQQEHSWLHIDTAICDKGYDALSNYRFLADKMIDPIILMRDAYKHGDLYDAKGRPICMGSIPMQYVHTDPEKGHKFRCDPDGCHLKWKVAFAMYCRDECYEVPKGDLLRKVGLVARASDEFRQIYSKRQTIERYFRSVKCSRLLCTHRTRGISRVRQHVSLSITAYLGTMINKAQLGRLDQLRRMRIRLPKQKVQTV